MHHNRYPNAYARIRGGREYPRINGMVNFYQGSTGLLVEVKLVGLPETEAGFFGFHIHAGGSCAGDGFPDTGGHFDPGGASHPGHAGDLPVILSAHGRAYMQILTDRFCVEEVIGKTVILHHDPDDFRTQPSGNAGMKIACGVIRRA